MQKHSISIYHKILSAVLINNFVGILYWSLFRLNNNFEVTPVEKKSAEFYNKIILFFLLLDILPEDRFASLETSRMTLLFFSISGLDVLGCLQTSLNEERRQEIIGNFLSLISDP